MAQERVARPGILARAGASVLFVVMVIGGLFLWIGIPLIWLWVASQMTGSTQPSLGPYVLIAFAVPLSMVVMAKALKRIDGLHSHLMRRQLTVHVQLPWLKSMRGERHTTRPTTALDVIMLATAGVALIALAIWFLGFAGSPLPNS